jgi:hypothetical protein
MTIFLPDFSAKRRPSEMKKMMFVMCLAFICIYAAPVTARDASSENQEAAVKAGGVKSIEDRISHREEAVARRVLGDNWFERVNISGLIEIEAMHQSVDYSDPAVSDEDSSDVDLATVELVVDARIADHVDGHVMFKYEEDDLFVDEGFITLSGTDRMPAWLAAGRQYLPFGYFDSHFVTDPATLLLGETNEGAVVAGYTAAEGVLQFSAGLFNGDIDEDNDDDMVDSFVASIAAQPFEPLMMGVSYTSNLLSSDSFSEFAVNPAIDDMVGGWSVFVTVSFLDRFKIIGEYVAAMDHFNAGEIYDAADTRQRKPSAWNLELGAAVLEDLELAVGYGGSDDGGDEFLPENQYGAVINWKIFDSTNLALEYLRAEFEDNCQETDTYTVQLAVEF